MAPPMPRVVGPERVASVRVRDGEAVRGSAGARVFDTRLRPSRPEVFGVAREQERAVREVLPPHEKRKEVDVGGGDAPASMIAMQANTTVPDERVEPEQLFPGPFQTEWRPPDPTLAVGPNHVVTTVNMAMAIYDKQGAMQYAIPLNNYGTPGLFETVGGAWFTFDPKCFYDHFAQRYVIVALETYASPFGAWIDIAVSDDSDPNGVWYTWRTEAVINNAWWDYPGFGFNESAWVVTGNLIGGTGVGFRVFDKAAMLGGGTATYATLVDTAAGTVQVAHHMGPSPAVYCVSTAGSSSLRVTAVTNPVGAPALVSANVAVPAWAGSGSVPTPTETLGLLSGWAMNACWRGGVLSTTHVAGANGRAVARWYQVGTGAWPGTGAPVLMDSGNVDAGAGLHVSFPSVMTDGDGDLGMVMNVCGASQNPGVAVAGRLASDPAGTFGRVRVVKVGESGEGGRFGDYTGIAADPVDPQLLWGIGEYKDFDGWHNWVASFRVEAPGVPVAVEDDAGDVSVARTVDVLANDYAPAGGALVIESFDSVSARGGAVTRSVGTGPGGRDQLVFTPSAAYTGVDSFGYVVRVMGTPMTAAGTVRANAFGASGFLASRETGPRAAGVRVAYYELSDPASFPDFAALTPYLTGLTTTINYGQSTGVFAGSGRADDVGAVFTGYFVANGDGVRRFFLSASEGARLYLDGVLVVDCSGPNSSILERSAAVGLRGGAHEMRLEYYERYERLGLTLTWTGGAGSLAHGDECDSVDFNLDGLFPDVADVEDFLNVFAGGTCQPPNPPACNNDIDFNNDGLFPDVDDIGALLRVFGGGGC